MIVITMQIYTKFPLSCTEFEIIMKIICKKLIHSFLQIMIKCSIFAALRFFYSASFLLVRISMASSTLRDSSMRKLPVPVRLRE